MGRAKNRLSPYLPLDKLECHGKVSEQRIGKGLQALMRPASGALDGCKGDMVVNVSANLSLLIEAKSTVNHSISLKKEWMDKIRNEAVSEGKCPLITLSFVNKFGGKQDNNSDWVAMPEYVLKALLDAARGG